MCVCAHMCVRAELREITSISAAKELGRERGAGTGVPAWRAGSWIARCLGCKSALIWGLQPRAQLHGNPQIRS